jgi:hypothetical protein
MLNNWNVTLSGLQAVRGYWTIVFPATFVILIPTIMLDVVVSFFLDIFAFLDDEDALSVETVVNPNVQKAYSHIEWKVIMNRKREKNLGNSAWWKQTMVSEDFTKTPA